jgi:hypothetical protein
MKAIVAGCESSSDVLPVDIALTAVFR